MRSYHLVPDTAAGMVVRERPVPVPGAGEVLVRMRAASLGFRDALVSEGDYPLPVSPGVVAGCEGAGDVVAVGEGTGRVKPGDRVALTVFPDWLDGPFDVEHAAQLGSTRDGTLAEYAVVPESALVPVPDHLSHAEAAALPLTAVTAWNALTGGRRVLPGETVVATGTGGVALAVVQLAALAGAHVIVTTGDPTKAERLRALGAHAVVDRRGDWPAEVRTLTAGRGAALVVDVAGALGESVRAAAIGGEVAYVGYRVADAPTGPPVDVRALFDAGVRIRPLAVGSRAQFLELTRALAVHGTHPVLDRAFAFDELAEAYARHRSGQAFGKVVVTFPSGD